MADIFQGKTDLTTLGKGHSFVLAWRIGRC